MTDLSTPVVRDYSATDVGWRADLRANCRRSGWIGLMAGWLTSPGFRVATRYRIARSLYVRGRLGRALAVLIEQTNANSGCFISAQARIGPGLRLPHPTGIVVGEGSVIGRDVALYQNVTLGRLHADKAGCPTIGDDVTIYAGAILIGSIHIGRGAIVGAHRMVKEDLPARSEEPLR